MAIMGNTLVVLFLYLDTQLHTPMYFLLGQLSLMDLMLISTTVPKMAFNHLSGSKPITMADCATHIFIYTSLTGCECFLWAVMAYDCNVATCHPLRYTSLMRPKICGLMTASSWVLGSTDGVIDAVVTFSFSYCGSRVVAHFCDFPFLLVIECNDTSIFEEVLFYCCIIIILFPVAVIIASYARVLLTVIHMGSGKGRHRVFATCSSHLMVVGMYYKQFCLCTCDLLLIVPHPGQDDVCLLHHHHSHTTLNPLIYSFHNKEVACAF